jgi:hypothetical protein
LTAQRNEKNEHSFLILVTLGTDLNHIKLPASLVADLYHSSLIDTDETIVSQVVADTIEDKPADHPGWKWLGENRKNILIIVNYTDAVHLPDNDLVFLTGIIGACKLSMADVAVVNLNNHPEASYKELVAFFKSKIVLLFAVEPASFGLPMSFPHFQIQPFAGNSFLFSPSLKELENDKVLKSKLWVCLKRLFNL